MIAGVSGLPSLGGLGGGFGAGPLPLVGFGVLNNLAGQLLTRPMVAPATAAPAFAPQELALGQLSNQFGNYFGTTSVPAFWGGAPADLAWRQWATGTAMPPLQVVPFGVPAPTFGAPGGALGFGVAGMPLAFTPSFAGAQQFMPGFGQIPSAFAGVPQMGPQFFPQPMAQGPVSLGPMPPMNFGQAPTANFSPGSWGAGSLFGSQAAMGGEMPFVARNAGPLDPGALAAQIERGLQTTLSQSSSLSTQFSQDALNNAMAGAGQQFQRAMEDQRAQQAAQAALSARIAQAGREAQAAQMALGTKSAETARLAQASQTAQNTATSKANQAALAAQTVQLAKAGLTAAKAQAAQAPTDTEAAAAVQAAEAELAQANQAAQAAKQAQAAAEAEAAQAEQAWRASQASESALTARATAATQAYEALRAEEAAIRQAQVDAFAADAMARMNAMQQQITSSFASSQRFQLPPR